MADIINQDALYRAGAASKSQGRNMEAESRNAMMATIVEGVSGFLNSQVEQQLKNHQEFKKQGQNQINDTLTKFNPAEVGINSHMETTVNELHDEYARLIRQKDTKGALKIFAHLANIDANIKMYKAGQATSIQSAKQLTGTGNTDGNTDGKAGYGAGTLQAELNNAAEQANGRMDQLLRYDVNGNNGKGAMFVVRGGEWKKNNNGVDTYYATQTDSNLGLTPFDLTDKSTWVQYSDMTFGFKADDYLSDKIRKVDGILYSEANKENGFVDEEYVRKETLMSMHGTDINTERFLQYFFGGLTNDYSNTRITESSPAYAMMHRAYFDGADGKLKMHDATSISEVGSGIDVKNSTIMYKENIVNGGQVDKEIDWENSKIEYGEGYGPDEEKWKAEEELLKKYIRDQDKQGSQFRDFAGNITADYLIKNFNTTRTAAVIRIENEKRTKFGDEVVGDKQKQLMVFMGLNPEKPLNPTQKMLYETLPDNLKELYPIKIK
jgi:hypothetical protein